MTVSSTSTMSSQFNALTVEEGSASNSVFKRARTLASTSSTPSPNYFATMQDAIYGLMLEYLPLKEILLFETVNKRASMIIYSRNIKWWNIYNSQIDSPFLSTRRSSMVIFTSIKYPKKSSLEKEEQPIEESVVKKEDIKNLVGDMISSVKQWNESHTQDNMTHNLTSSPYQYNDYLVDRFVLCRMGFRSFEDFILSSHKNYLDTILLFEGQKKPSSIFELYLQHPECIHECAKSWYTVSSIYIDEVENPKPVLDRLVPIVKSLIIHKFDTFAKSSIDPNIEKMFSSDLKNGTNFYSNESMRQTSHLFTILTPFLQYFKNSHTPDAILDAMAHLADIVGVIRNIEIKKGCQLELLDLGLSKIMKGRLLETGLSAGKLTSSLITLFEIDAFAMDHFTIDSTKDCNYYKKCNYFIDYIQYHLLNIWKSSNNIEMIERAAKYEKATYYQTALEMLRDKYLQTDPKRAAEIELELNSKFPADDEDIQKSE